MGGKSTRFFARKHDIILFYTKEKKYKFYSMKKKRRLDFKPNLPLTSSSGKPIEDKTGKDEFGYYSIVSMDDVWDIKGVFNMSKEHLGYPTQKPEALLERIIKASSNEDDIIFDPFCGCGTTIKVASDMGRKWIGVDISRIACDVMKERMGGGVEIIGGESEEELREMNPHDFARLVIREKLGGTVNPKKSGDMGIDGWTELRTIPVQVKRWGNKVGRPEIDKFKTAIERDKKDKGIVVAFDFSRDCYEEVERIKHEHKIDIQLKRVSELFGLGE